MNDTNDTIVALATAMGESSIHILRLSGSDVEKIMEACFVPKNKARWLRRENYTLHLGIFRYEDKTIDEVLVGRMLAPASYTGEDVYEVNCHGGIFIARRILQACLHQGARLAEPGEFSKRAFLNGKMDLIQAEAVIDLISSRTETASDMALGQLQGILSDRIIQLREQLLEIVTFIEAGIDFPEDDVESLDRDALEVKVKGALHKSASLLKESKTGKILREGLFTVIVGRPNVGKSSLLNALLREERAIVSEFPGTTRDEIRESVNVGGILLKLVDTAGICKSQDLVERLGIERTWKALQTAELILLVLQAGVPLNEDEKRILDLYGDKVIVLANKIDLIEERNFIPLNQTECWIRFSVLRHEGFEILEKEIQKRVYRGEAIQKTDSLLSNVRQIAALENCHVALEQGLAGIRQGLPWDILSIDLREALRCVSEVTGQDVQESLLEDIFSRFCIGK